MSTIEDNKLIAEFMGWDINNISTIPTNLHLSNLELDNGEKFIEKFDSSWDWLMPVIKKVNEVSGYNDYNTDRLHIQRVLDDCINENAVGIDEVHKAVVEFIKQHND